MLINIHHAGLPSSDWTRSKEFRCGVLGMRSCPGKDNWLGWDGTTYPIHLMPQAETAPSKSLARHIAIEVESLEAIVAVLLDAGLAPFQASLADERCAVKSPEQQLDFGIGTIFVLDLDRNVVEFVQYGRGQVKLLAG